MARLLKFLVVVMCVLSVTALALGVRLFQHREELKGRTQKLEAAFFALGPALEAEAPPAGSEPDYPARDVDAVGARLLDEPSRSDFWERYDPALEAEAKVTVDVAGRRDQLMHYYKVDPATGEPAVDAHTGKRVTTGPGTMQAVLDDVVSTAESQLARLNRTRDQLRRTRSELVTTIERLNSRKQDLRESLVDLDERVRRIAALEHSLRERDVTVERQHEQIAMLTATIGERDRRIAAANDAHARLKDELVVCRHECEPGTEPSRGGGGITHGYKGTVRAVNPAWNFVVVSLTEEFMRQYAKASDRAATAPQPDLIVSRNENGRQVFVTKIRLDDVRPAERVGVADLLAAWEQAGVRAGDNVYY